MLIVDGMCSINNEIDADEIKVRLYKFMSEFRLWPANEFNKLPYHSCTDMWSISVFLENELFGIEVRLERP